MWVYIEYLEFNFIFIWMLNGMQHAHMYTRTFKIFTQNKRENSVELANQNWKWKRKYTKRKENKK